MFCGESTIEHFYKIAAFILKKEGKVNYCNLKLAAWYNSKIIKQPLKEKFIAKRILTDFFTEISEEKKLYQNLRDAICDLSAEEQIMLYHFLKKVRLSETLKKDAEENPLQNDSEL